MAHNPIVEDRNKIKGWIREKWIRKGLETEFNQLNSKLDKTCPRVLVWLEGWGLILKFVNDEIIGSE